MKMDWLDGKYTSPGGGTRDWRVVDFSPEREAAEKDVLEDIAQA
jgi:hypothetical protein